MVDIDERILNVIKGQHYLIHHNDEKGFADLGKNGVCIEVLNGDKGNSIFIDRDDEYTLSFGYMHSHYSTDDDAEIRELAELIDDILHNKVCVASIGNRTEDNQFVWGGSTFSASEAAQIGNMEALFPYEYSLLQKRKHRKQYNEIILQYWDSSLDRIILINKEAMKRKTKKRKVSMWFEDLIEIIGGIIDIVFEHL